MRYPQFHVDTPVDRLEPLSGAAGRALKVDSEADREPVSTVARWNAGSSQ